MNNTTIDDDSDDIALLVGIQKNYDRSGESSELLSELQELVENINISVADKIITRIRYPNSRLLLGSGKAIEIIELAKKYKCKFIIFDDELTPSQQRNWERESGLCVIDRQEVILEIFARRAQTKEAVLQVDLAQMEYSLPRLKRAWTHLHRQRGGGVALRGSGEMQLETDKRLVRSRIAKLKSDLFEVIQHRIEQRKQRSRIPLPTAALVGYTNAGKSSLLNCLTQSNSFVADKLFATLDPTTRRMKLPSGQTLLLTDTVGFIRRLPHRLIDAFKATLEETLVTDFLIHVVDVSHVDYEKHRETTLSVLNELDAEDKKIITVFNKIDLVDDNNFENMYLENIENNCVTVSAHTKQGIENLYKVLQKILNDFTVSMNLLIPYNSYELLGEMRLHGGILEEIPCGEGVFIKGNIPNRLVRKLKPYLYSGDMTEISLMQSDYIQL